MTSRVYHFERKKILKNFAVIALDRNLSIIAKRYKGRNHQLATSMRNSLPETMARNTVCADDDKENLPRVLLDSSDGEKKSLTIKTCKGLQKMRINFIHGVSTLNVISDP